jgi:putative peptidoglycan lipid II flippase
MKPGLPGLPGVARSTLLVMAATLASMLLGFAREIVNARSYGTRWELDTFLAAATIPTILFGLFNGALVSALLPVFSAYLARGEEEAAWALGNTVFHILAITLTLCAVLGWIFAPWYVPVIAHGFPPPQMQVAVRMTRWLMPSIVATSLAGIANAMLNAYHRFTAASFQGLAINLVTIVVTLALLDRFGIYALVLGTALGLLAALLVQLPSYLLLGHYRCVIDWRHPGLRKIWLMLAPIVLGSAAGQLALLFDRFFASTLAPGYISGMNYAGKLIGFPQQLFAAAVATVIFPLLANQFSNDDVAGVRRSVMTGLRVVNFVTIPAVFALASLATPLVSTLFQRGAFTGQASLLCASLLPFAALSLVPIAANMVLTRCCYACHESRRPVAASVLAVAINIILSILWLPTLGAKGLLLANGVSQWVQTAWLLILVRRLAVGLEWRRLLGSAARVTVASTMMAATVVAARASLGPPADDFPARLLNLSLLLVTAAVAFLVSAKLLHLDEVRILWTLMKKRVGGPALAARAESAEVPIG